MLAMGMWIEYEENYLTYGGPLAENSPPNAAVGVICAVLIISSLLYLLRKPLRLVSAELVVIYSALVLSAPLMTQGMWHRMVGLIVAIPHNQDFKSYDSYPSMLWPHGPNLCTNGQFRAELSGFTHSGGGSITWTNIDRGRKGVWKSPALSNDGATNSQCTLSYVIDRYDGKGREVLVPGESYLFSMLVKSVEFAKGAGYFVRLQPDVGPEIPLLASAEETSPTYANPEGFRRIGVNPVTLPATLDKRLTLNVSFSGPGRLVVQDIEFFNNQAVEGLYAGRKLIREKDLSKFDANERDFTSVRPANMFSVAGLKYLFTGYIPLDQWVQPALSWGLLVAAIFFCLLGLNILMRKQWAENERFTFPMTILPKSLFADEDGRLTIFRNRIMWLGFACTLPLVLAKGINFYFPSFPTVYAGGGLSFAQYVTNPLLKAYLGSVGIGIGAGLGLSFCALAIALLIETDILFAMFSMFLIFQLWNLFGKAFNLTSIPGYPWADQQGMGGFIAYALLAVFVGRAHLWHALRTALGRPDPLDQSQEVTTHRTAFIMVIFALLVILWWGVWTGMGAKTSLLFFGYMLVCGFAASKIRAEMGAPWGYLTPYYGMAFMGAIGGFAVFGSTGMLVASIAAGFMCPTCFLLIAPTQVEMMELGRHFKVRPRDIGSGLTLGLLGGLFIGGFVLLCVPYGLGANNLKTSWPYEQNWYMTSFRSGEANADRAMIAGTLNTTPETQPLNFSKNVDAKGLGIGATITLVLAFLRANVSWFPFHPLGYALASSNFMVSCWFSFFLAWILRLLLFRIGGAHIIRRGLVPFCVGMFLACIASIVVFDIVGVIMRMNGIMEVYARIP